MTGPARAFSRTLLLGSLFAAVGVLFATSVVGWTVINPVSVGWVSGDPATGQLGWMFFRNQESLAFPFGWAASLGYPLGEPMAYLDSMPLVGLLFWPFRHILPDTFQYLGLWFALCSVLQFYFGYRVSRHLTNNDTLSSVVGGLLFMMAPPFAWRALAHFALTSHWLIVAALEFYLAASARMSRLRMAGGAAICFVAGGINPYITLLVLMLVGAGYLKSTMLAARDRDILSAVKVPIIGIIASVGAAAVALWAFGFIVGGDAKGYAGEGYGFFSMNLLAPIDPTDYPALLLKKLPSFPGQYEGYNYLGLGVIALLAAAIVRSPKAVAGYLLHRDAAFARLVVIVSTLLALSLKMTAGEKVFFDMAPPPFIYDLLSAFRASGRLFWAAFYVILAAAIGSTFIAFGKRTALVLTVALLIQAADLRGLYDNINLYRAQLSANDMTKSAVWQTMARAHKNLVVIPAWQCDRHKTPGGKDDGYWIFGRLAAENRMTINSFYAGRTTPKQTEFFCNEQPAQITKDGLSSDTAYVFSDDFLTPAIKLRGHYCRRVDGVILCSTELGKEGFDKGVFEKAAQ